MVEVGLDRGQEVGTADSREESGQGAIEVTAGSKLRRGRPSNADKLMRERRGSGVSVASVESWLSKRTRESETEDSGEDGEKGRQEIKKKRESVRREKESLDDKVEKMDEFKEMMQKMLNEMKEDLKAKMEENKEELKRELQKQKEDYERRDMARQQEIEELKKEIYMMKKREEMRERREKKKNVIISGIGQKEGDAKKVACETMKGLGVNVACVKEAVYVGKVGEKKILVEMEVDEKRNLMLKKSKLKGSKVYIDDDMTKYERDRQRKIRQWAMEERKKGMNVRVGYGKGFVNGREFVWCDENERMEEKGWRTESMNM